MLVLLAPTSGLAGSSVFRLKQSWPKVERAKISKFEELQALVSPLRNSIALREMTYNTLQVPTKLTPQGPTVPLLPYIGLYLSDLTFIEDGNPNTVVHEGHEMINYGTALRLTFQASSAWSVTIS